MGMSRAEAIERAAQAITDWWFADGNGGMEELLENIKDALAMPKDAERVALCEPIIRSQQYNDEVYKDGA